MTDIMLELKMYKELYEETNQLLIETRAKLVEITAVIESRPTKPAPDACPACSGKGSVRVGVYSEDCQTCNGTGKRR